MVSGVGRNGSLVDRLSGATPNRTLSTANAKNHALIPLPARFVHRFMYKTFFAVADVARSRLLVLARQRLQVERAHCGLEIKASEYSARAKSRVSHHALIWAQRSTRVFDIDIETSSKCGGAASVIACVKDSVVIDKITTHRDKKAALAEPAMLPQSPAPPQTNLFD